MSEPHLLILCPGNFSLITPMREMFDFVSLHLRKDERLRSIKINGSSDRGSVKRDWPPTNCCEAARITLTSQQRNTSVFNRHKCSRIEFRE
jgi:hypothetical protein